MFGSRVERCTMKEAAETGLCGVEYTLSSLPKRFAVRATDQMAFLMLERSRIPQPRVSAKPSGTSAKTRQRNPARGRTYYLGR